MTEIDKAMATATAEPPGGLAKAEPSLPQPLIKSPPPKKLELDQRSQSSSSTGANGGAGSSGLATAPGSSGGRKRRRARKRPRSGRRRYKPYHKLTYEEQRELDTKETARAEQRRAAQFSNGRAMAPYNTTQFIMEDLEARNLEPDVAALVEKLNDRCGSRERTYSGTGSFDSESWASPSDDDESSYDLDAEFDAQYETVHVERLESLSKPELIENVISLEADVSRAGVESRELRQMVQRLRADNYQLRKTLREAGLPDARPNSAPPRQPPPALPSAPPPADPDHTDTNTDTSSSKMDDAPTS